MEFDVTRLRGSFTALVTPFAGGRVDEDGVKRVVEHQIDNGTHGLVPVGTTGESPTVSHAEHKRVVELTVNAAKGRAVVLAGAGSNATAEAIELGLFAKSAGADAIMCVVPYYNRPTQEGLYRHFAAIAEAVDLPLVVYNVPGRTACDVSVETLGRLSRIANIVGVKDATAKIERATQQRLACGPSFRQLSGEDATAVAFNAQGGHGCISVTANVAPRLCAQMQEATLKGDFAAANAINDRLMPLHEALFVETNPGPVKYAASLLGLCAEDVRLPLAPVSDATKARVKAALQAAGVL